MSEHFKPLEYDKERVDLFYKRVTRQGNLPYLLKPPKDANLSAFCDAILGAYEEDTATKHTKGSERYDAYLSRLALTISYLQGMPLGELNEAAADIKYSGRQKGEKIALDVGSVGGRFYSSEAAEKREDSENLAYLFESIEEFTDLGDLIRRLYEEKRVTAGEASALLLFIAREDSRADPQVKYTAAINIAAQIRVRLRTAMGMQLRDGESLINQTFERGARHLQEIINDPVNRLNQIAIHSSAHSPAIPQNEESQRLQREIDGHVGYVLDKLYS